MESVKQAGIDFPSDMEEDLRELCEKMTAVDPSARLEIEQVIHHRALYPYVIEKGAVGSSLSEGSKGLRRDKVGEKASPSSPVLS
jgi:hypothetical protein